MEREHYDEDAAAEEMIRARHREDNLFALLLCELANGTKFPMDAEGIIYHDTNLQTEE